VVLVGLSRRRLAYANTVVKWRVSLILIQIETGQSRVEMGYF